MDVPSRLKFSLCVLCFFLMSSQEQILVQNVKLPAILPHQQWVSSINPSGQPTHLPADGTVTGTELPKAFLLKPKTEN